MSDHETTRQHDHKTKGNQWSVVSSQRRQGAFTLAELVVSTGVLVLLVFLATQLINNVATVTILGNKKMDADSQARQVFDRMAVDFEQMVKRAPDTPSSVTQDVDYYLKSPQTGTPDCTTCTAQTTTDINRNDPTGNDQMAFFAATPGYYPNATPTTQSPFSLIAYRVNSDPNSSSYNKLERMAKGLIWNGVDATYTPIVFLPQTIASTLPAWSPSGVSPLCQATISGTPSATCTGTADPSYEIVGSQVFRFEYCYLLKGQVANGEPRPINDRPWIDVHTSVSGMRDVAAIVVTLAVIDPKSKGLLSDTTIPPQIRQVATKLIDWGDASCGDDCTPQKWQTTPGLLRTQWQNKLNGIINPNSPDFDPSLPPAAISGIRVYERYFYLTH